MSSTPPSQSPLQQWLNHLSSPQVGGVVFGLFSAVGYTGANICLRSVTHCDPIWVSCVKAFPTIALISPWLLVLAYRGQRIVPPVKVLVALALAALLGHLGGNVAFQWSLGVIGMALSVPILMGTMIVSGVVLGRLFLDEGITTRIAVSTAILIVAICVLSLGAGDAHHSISQNPAIGAKSYPMVLMAIGVAAAALSGLAYSVLGVVIRYGVTGKAPISSTLVIVASVGMTTLGGLSYARLGLDGMWNTDQQDLGMMIMAGLCNAGAFLALTKALQLTTVAYVNALNATQVTMAAVAGVLIFGESTSTAMSLGVALTAVGMVLMKRNKRPAETAQAEPAESSLSSKPKISMEAMTEAE